MKPSEFHISIIIKYNVVIVMDFRSLLSLRISMLSEEKFLWQAEKTHSFNFLNLTESVFLIIYHDQFKCASFFHDNCQCRTIFDDYYSDIVTLQELKDIDLAFIFCCVDFLFQNLSIVLSCQNSLINSKVITLTGRLTAETVSSSQISQLNQTSKTADLTTQSDSSAQSSLQASQ